MADAEPLIPVNLPLPFPDVDRMKEVMVLVVQAGEAWDADNVEGFVAVLAKAFSLDVHDFNHVMDGRKQMRRACAAVDVLGERGADSVEFHILKMAMSMVETEGFSFFHGTCYKDLSRNYVLAKWTRSVPSTLRVLDLLSKGSIASLPKLEYWRILLFLGAVVNCLGNIELATTIYRKVKILAVDALAETSDMAEIDRDIVGLERYPANTCCVCSVAGNANACAHCGISCYCSKRCQEADWRLNHEEVCGSLVDWEKVVFHTR